MIEDDKITNEDYYHVYSLLKDIQSFANNHESMSYIEFDYYVVHDMTLFSVEPDFDFKKLASIIYRLKKITSAMRRILSNPIIVLKDVDEIVPVKNARLINQNTLLHLSSHTQFVANITERGIKPRKLLSRVYEDDYSIYENIIFCNFLDEVLSFVRRNQRVLNNLLYASNVMQFNLLEKVNHVNYFLALGKLQTGYVRDFSEYYTISKELTKELNKIERAIKPRLNKAVYQKNLKRNKKLALKKTNIFLMQKDYHQIYKTYKMFLKEKNTERDNELKIDYKSFDKNYFLYVQILFIFSIGHFNFEMDSDSKIEFDSLNVKFNFKKWKLSIKSNKKQELILTVKKDITYKIMIISSVKHNDYTYDEDKYDEIIRVSPFDEDYQTRDDIYISMEDIDSFRRIQQILLKAMIYSDQTRDICPFCGAPLRKELYDDVYRCDNCMTQIKEGYCPETNKKYFYTDVLNFKKYSIKKISEEKNAFYRVETAMFFRNITKINDNFEIVCPYCNKVHRN